MFLGPKRIKSKTSSQYFNIQVPGFVHKSERRYAEKKTIAHITDLAFREESHVTHNICVEDLLYFFWWRIDEIVLQWP